ncbi:MAG: ANTAR domain-containing protein [Clostridia bacterium]
MKTALIVSRTGQSVLFIKDMLKLAAVPNVDTATSCEEARAKLFVVDYDLVIINAPLQDEFGEKFSVDIAKEKNSQVMLIVKNDIFDDVSLKTEKYGVISVSKPVNKTIFWSALKIAKSSFKLVRKFQEENTKLRQTLEDVKIIDRAKLLLISHLGMDEQSAHRYIEKQAMDLRSTKREVSEGILKTYANK